MKSGKTVLIVDDDQAVRDVLRDTLESNGHLVLSCPDGESALLMARERAFDAIVTDYRMPGVNGAVVAGTIRVLHPQTIIVGMSGSDDGQNLIAAGVHVFMKKPIDFDRLESIIRGDGPL